MIGETIGHYRVQAELGSGGMGVVYRAEDLKLGRLVALKFLADSFADDAAIHGRFLREARAAATLSHPNVCTIYEINDNRERPFIAMELLEGRSLQERLAAGPMRLGDVFDLGAQIADALAAAHSKGLIHRDIKPGNIFITEDGRAKVVDFGLAKAIDPPRADRDQSAVETVLGQQVGVTRIGSTVGTVAYMSPEQARGETLDTRSDIFSLGLVLYEMATGRRAFDGQTAAVVFDGILNRVPAPPSVINPAVPLELEQVIGCAIEKGPAKRYQSAADIANDLRRLRRASDPSVDAAQVVFTPSVVAPSPAWGVTPARGVVTLTPPPVHPQASLAGRLWRHKWAALAGLILAVAVSAVIIYARRATVVGEGAPVLVADFVNRTGDGDFDATLKQALTIKLEESPYLRVMSPQKVQQMLSLMARKPDDPVTAALGRDMCQRMGGGALMTGEISKLGSSYVLTLAAESCSSGEQIWREQAQANRKEDVLHALGTQVTSVRQRLGESLASVNSHNKPLVEATTSSLAALRSFSLGDQKRAAGADQEAMPFYQRAIDLDPQFALAYARLGTLCSNTGEIEKAKKFYEKAYELRDRAGDRERLYITTHYFRIKGDLAKTREMYELWRQTYPHDFVPVHNLGIVYEEMGDLESALRAFRDASAMEPRNPLARESTASTLMALGRFAEARQVAEQQVRELGDLPQPHALLYQLDYLVGDRAGMADHARKITGTIQDIFRRGVDAQIAAFEGRFADASRLFERVAESAESQGRLEGAQGARAGQILDRAMVGFTSDTRSAVARLLAEKPSAANKLTLAFALLVAGDTSRARALAAPLWADIGGEGTGRPITRIGFGAFAELREGRPARAIELLKEAEAWEDKLAKDAFLASDVRGLAYLALGKGQAAEAQFARRLSKPGLNPFDVARPLAHLFIGRARALAGDQAGARRAYDEFFTMWKNADGDIPLLRQAKAEYAKL